MTDVLVHVVLFKFHRETTPAQREELLAKLRLLGRQSGGEEAGILFWQVDQNGDQRKNWHLVELAVFRDRASLENFRAHPAHDAVGREMSKVADWAVGDLSAALPLAL